MKKPVLQIGNGNWGTKDRSLLGYADGDTIDQFKAKPINFERGTNLGATRVGKDGLVEKGRRNLLSFSNNFDNPIWIGEASWAGGQAGYDGTNNAWNFTKNGATNSDLYNESFSGLQTFSIYAKKEDNKGLKIIAFHTGGEDKRASFNLATGEDVASASDKGVHSHAEDLNNGWWRLSFTINQTGAKWYLYTTDGTNNQIITTVTLQNAQLEYGVAPSKYINTGSAVNLLRNTNQIEETPWTVSSGMGSITPNQLGYDGTQDAFLLTKTGQWARIEQKIPKGISQDLVLSAYVKSNALDNVVLRVDSDPDGGDDRESLGEIQVNIDTLEKVKESHGAKAHATKVGDGWTRVEMRFDGARTTGSAENDEMELYIYPAHQTDGAGGTTGSIFIQDIQMEIGSAASSYVENTELSGIFTDQPRIDYSDTDPHLLLEPERQNFMDHSEYMGDYTFTDCYSTVTHNHGISPEGIKNSTLFSATAESDSVGHRLYGSNTFTAEVGETYTVSVFAKKGTKKYLAMTLRQGNQAVHGHNDVIFDLEDGSTSGTNASTGSSEDYGNGWFRCTITAAMTNTSDIDARPYLFISGSSSEVSYANSTTSDNMEIYGLQVEKGSFATSYIPAYGTSVTRQAEGTGQYDMQDFFDGNDFTLFVDLEENPDLDRDDSNLNIRLSEINDFSGSLRIYRSSSASGVSVLFYPNDSQVDTAISLDNATKIAIRRVESTGVFTAFTDGVSATHVTNPYTNTSFDQMRQLRIQGGGSTMKLKGIKIYDKALTDAECIELTS